ncbi:MAG: TRAP transporter substrate-binding protein [Alphaproteobacteria bacterium]
MKNILRKFLTTTATIAAFTSVANAADYEWTMQSSDQPGIFMYQMEEQFSGWVKDMSQGRIEITVTPTNSVVPYSEVLDAVGSNILQGQFDDPSYFAGKDAAFGFIGNSVGAWSSPAEALKYIYYGGGLEVAQKLYDEYNVHLIGFVMTGVESFVSSKKLNGVDDLKGLKVRAPEGMVQKVFAAAGASPVNLPGSEVYTALEKGVIDAADFSLFSVNQSQGMHDIGNHPVYPGFHSAPTLAVTLSKEIWDDLPADLKAVLETAVRRLAMDVMFQYEMQDVTSVAKAKADGIDVTDWSAEERAKFRKIAIEQWGEFTNQSPIAKEYADKLSAFLKEQGLVSE